MEFHVGDLSLGSLHKPGLHTSRASQSRYNVKRGNENETWDNEAKKQRKKYKKLVDMVRPYELDTLVVRDGKIEMSASRLRTISFGGVRCMI